MHKNIHIRFVAATLLLLLCQSVLIFAQDSLRAFPGAEGFGAWTKGGRGGRVLRVTNLNATGAGSFQAACSSKGPRIIVFDVSGVIPGDIHIDNGQVTIMGQTAPGAGITIQGQFRTKYVPLEDIVVRFVRVRPDRQYGETGDAIQFSKVTNCILDHVSCSWATDENMDFYNASNVTIQWCTVEEGDTQGHDEGQHNTSMLLGPNGNGYSVHHNLMAHNRRRNPGVCNGPADIRNNVVYDFRDGVSHEGHTPRDSSFNIVGNYYISGPSDPKMYPFNFVGEITYYLNDNYLKKVGIIDDPWAERDKSAGLDRYADSGVKAEIEFAVPSVTTQPSEEAYDLVLDNAGCFPRDTVTVRSVNEVRSGTGIWGRHDPGDLMAGLVPAEPPIDADRDGMADNWEILNGLDPDNGDDHATVLPSGYTAIEEYCNMLAARLIENKGWGALNPRDFNMDGELNMSDVIGLILIAVHDRDNPAYDINGDGRFSVSDAIALLLSQRV